MGLFARLDFSFLFNYILQSN